MRPISCLFPILLALSASACANGTWVELAGQRYRVEVADDDAERQRGLMFRDEMAQDHGMLFVHEDEEPLAYWMKNTKIPLDILYFDHARKLVAQQRDVPPCTAGDRCPSYPSQTPEGEIVSARFVLELNAGQAARMNLKDGAELRFGPGIHDAP
ncbi:DUF192 domain-containing protein [Luteimonas aquatica]|uniref:DUF192 domain-containing protein n=1 Tax=Luteimonas aquatica TaxID=450364 RepID=UPI001F572822|nr:DUF192 domain-containing protein [Luteimonas aquatica]